MTYPFPEGNVGWQPKDIIALLCTKMSPDDWRPITGAAVLWCESWGSPRAIGKVIWKPGQPDHLSIDLGLFQLNSYWWPGRPRPEVCFDPFKAYELVWPVLTRNKTWSYDWTPWICYTGGYYKSHLNFARQGMIQYREIMGLPKGPF